LTQRELNIWLVTNISVVQRFHQARTARKNAIIKQAAAINIPYVWGAAGRLDNDLAQGERCREGTRWQAEDNCG
jgi:hypothetical protein